ARVNNARTFVRQLRAIEGDNGKTILNSPDVIDDLESAYGAAQRPPVKPKVVARSVVDGHIFEDTNQGARVAPDMDRPTLIADRIVRKQAKTPRPLPNGNMRTAHAEIGNIQQAYDAGVTKGADMKMHVTGEPVCGYCNGDIAAAARAAELNSLTILEEHTGKTFVWRPGMKAVEKGLQ
ncbi:MAG: cytidine deaminase-like fold-containing protein, partial [Nitrospirota bacterium]